MEYSILQQSSIRRDLRQKRIISFVRIGLYIFIIGGILWAPISIIEGTHWLTFIDILSVFLGVYCLILIKKNYIQSAKIISLLIATNYITLICVFYSGYGIANGGTPHFWFLVMCVAAYFLLHDFKPVIRDGFPIVLLGLFFAFHFGYAPIKLLNQMSPEVIDINNKVSAIMALIGFFFITRLYVIEITRSEQALTISADRLEGLIQSMLPKSIAERLEKEGKTFADEFHDCSVLFADISEFTKWSENRSPNEVANRLNNIFSQFDDAVDHAQLTKIKTIGDCYMVAAGVPEYRKDHAILLTRLAMRFQQIAAEYSDFQFRIGINSGSVVAGVIGRKIFIYDLWGDTVNIASRMESSGAVGKVNVTDQTYQLIKDEFRCTYRGKVDAKNKGKIDMYFVEGSKNFSHEQDEAASLAGPRLEGEIVNSQLSFNELKRS